jgi:hypothetical protein
MTMSDALPAKTTASPLPLSDRSGVTDAVRAQILATEHWSLLATRGMTWNEVFSRASMFITVLSAAVVALALVAQVTAFGPSFHLFALLILPVVLVVGLATTIMLGEANTEDFVLVAGLNRLRHGYLDLAPELEPYFITAHHDDPAVVMVSYGMGSRRRFSRYLAGTPNLVAAINIVICGVFVALIAQTLGASDGAALVAGLIAAVGAIASFVAWEASCIRRAQRAYQPHFPA